MLRARHADENDCGDYESRNAREPGHRCSVPEGSLARDSACRLSPIQGSVRVAARLSSQIAGRHSHRDALTVGDHVFDQVAYLLLVHHVAPFSRILFGPVFHLALSFMWAARTCRPLLNHERTVPSGTPNSFATSRALNPAPSWSTIA